MPFLVYMPICFSRVFCTIPAWNNRSTAPLFNPADKFITVITFIGQNKITTQIKGF